MRSGKRQTYIAVAIVSALALVCVALPIQRAQAHATTDPAVTPGTLVRRTLETDPHQTYYLYVPSSLAKGAPIFVTVHGVSRNVHQHAVDFVPYAERYGVVLVAPYFSVKRFPGYQRLDRGVNGQRPDVVLDRIVSEVAAATGADLSRLYLFGYSGGAQFVHRYMLAHPERVARVAIGAAGWYTFPNAAVKFPRGIGAAAAFRDLRFDPERFLSVPALVAVGDEDNVRDAELRATAKVDGQQGNNRQERGHNWIAAMKRDAAEHDLPTLYEFTTVPHCGHSFPHCMKYGGLGDVVFRFLFGETPFRNAKS